MNRSIEIRTAEIDEQPELVRLKKTYSTKIFQGYFSEDILKKSIDEYSQKKIDEWMQNDSSQIAVLLKHKTMAGYMAFGEDPYQQGGGIIFDYGFKHEVNTEDKTALFRWTDRQIRSQHLAGTRIWMVRENLKERFFIESKGFRRCGDPREVIRAGKTITVVPYEYLERQEY